MRPVSVCYNILMWWSLLTDGGKQEEYRVECIVQLAVLVSRLKSTKNERQQLPSCTHDHYPCIALSRLLAIALPAQKLEHTFLYKAA